MAEDVQDGQGCRFTGPDGEGFFWLWRAETTGGFGMVNLGCCDEDDLLTAMVNVLVEKGWLEPDDAGGQFASPTASGLFGGGPGN